MPYPTYTTNWVNPPKELPQVGEGCPLCEQNTIEDNCFTDKKQKRWQSVKCNSCLVKWIMGQGKEAFKKSSPETGGDLEKRVKALEDRQENIVKVLDILRRKK